ncbi:hypothetical protein M422DRAFT_26342, partial [Sphaerobolus stellatus SS14]
CDIASYVATDYLTPCNTSSLARTCREIHVVVLPVLFHTVIISGGNTNTIGSLQSLISHIIYTRRRIQGLLDCSYLLKLIRHVEIRNSVNYPEVVVDIMKRERGPLTMLPDEILFLWIPHINSIAIFEQIPSKSMINLMEFAGEAQQFCKLSTCAHSICNASLCFVAVAPFKRLISILICLTLTGQNFSTIPLELRNNRPNGCLETIKLQGSLYHRWDRYEGWTCHRYQAHTILTAEEEEIRQAKAIIKHRFPPQNAWILKKEKSGEFIRSRCTYMRRKSQA